MSSDDPRRVVIVELAILINGREPLKFDMTQEVNLKGGLEVKLNAFSPRRAPYAHHTPCSPHLCICEAPAFETAPLRVKPRPLRVEPRRSKQEPSEPVGIDGR